MNKIDKCGNTCTNCFMQALGIRTIQGMHYMNNVHTIHFPCYITLCNKAMTIFLSAPRIHSHPPFLRDKVKCPMLRLIRHPSARLSHVTFQRMLRTYPRQSCHHLEASSASPLDSFEPSHLYKHSSPSLE